MKKIKSCLIVLIALLLLVWLGFNYLVSRPNSQEAKLVYFTIESGESVKQIANNLANRDLVNSAWLFRLYVWSKKADSKLLAGEHRLSADMNIKEVFKVLTTGNSVDNEKKVTIIEGWRQEEIADYLAKEGLVGREEFLNAIKVKDWQGQYDFLAGVKAETLEGFLFPDTYRVFNDATAQEIVKKMLDNFDGKLTAEMRADIKKQDKTIFTIITMASIVEREGLSEENKKMIADIFWKRLAAGIPLQSDATINYITGKKDRRPLLADLELKSPYNTYKNQGLPPGPIANPGLAAIKAAIYPQKNNYYYFIHDENGQTIFAKTYDEHLANIQKYLK